MQFDDESIDNESGSTVEDRLWERLKLKTGKTQSEHKRKHGYLLLQLPRQPNLPLEHRLEWAKVPFRYQIEGIEMLVSRQALLLADDMGLGKTIQAISAIRILVYRKQVEQSLIVVPAGLISQWSREIRLLAPELHLSTVYGPAEDRSYQWSTPAQVFLTGYETLREDFTTNPQSPPGRRVWDLVVLDEAQRIKNAKTEISRKCKLLLRQRAWALTGTPLENRIEDLASILEFTRPLRQGDQMRRIIPGAKMRELQRNLQLRRKKSEVLRQLPPKMVSTIYLPLTGKQRETYDRAEEEGILYLKEKGTGVRISNVLELILRLKQICNFCPVSKESGKMEDMLERINVLVAEGHRAIIFSQFVQGDYGVLAISRRLKQYQPLVFTGSLNIREKDNLIRKFKNDPDRKVMLISLRAGGQGLNLQEASYVFHFDRWWNPALEHHAEDRSHRQGQTLPVHVYRYTCENTIEERIENILQCKQRLFNEQVDDVTIDLRLRLTEEELFGLFGLVPPPRQQRSPVYSPIP
ncbi:MAG: DEAD/DEAH box helicase [Dehalococcoidales bacterium]|nr:DEAD/DEAH box helicase [Dehalococcoidales bacterium]